MARFIVRVALGTRKRGEIVQFIYEIARRDGRDVKDILEDTELQRILDEKHLDPPQRGANLYNYLRDLRYPAIHEYRQRFEEKLRALGVDRNIHLVLPDNFEKWEFKIDFSFSSLEEYRERINKLVETGKSRAFEELMALRV